MPGITGGMRTLRQIFRDDYAIGDFQRGYTWGPGHVATLVRDLARAYERRREPDVSGDYYLGAIVTHNRYGFHQIIDGQQRMTTLQLLLTWLRHELQDQNDRREAVLTQLIRHDPGGRPSFAIDVAERARVMQALYEDPGVAKRVGAAESDTERNLLEQFDTISESFPDDLRADGLGGFVDWLLDRVFVAKIEAEKEADAYTIFETTNDRGQKLGPAQLVKNHLQAQIEDADARDRALSRWVAMLREMQKYGFEGDLEFINLWLQGRYADLPTPANRASDLARIRGDLFNWFKANAARIGLTDSEAHLRFMHDEFAAMAEAYAHIRKAEEFPERGLDSLYFLQNLNLPWHAEARALVLGAVEHRRSPAENAAKMRAAAAFAEIFAARLIWARGLSTSLSRVQDREAFEAAIADVRDGSPATVVERLTRRLQTLHFGFDDGQDLSLPKNANARSRRVMHALLARMSACFDEMFGDLGAYQRYEIRSQARGFSIEHVLPADANGEKSLFESASAYAKRRNRIGALLLIRRADNEALGDVDFATRRLAYRQLTRLARTFDDEFYGEEARRVLARLELAFEPFDKFGPAELEKRQKAYIRLAELTWNPGRVAFAARPAAPEDSRVYALDDHNRSLS